ncbi:LysR family transcriptional regulator [Lutimaribacter saemankumensis]|uniref:DNA-binding transcriptional regulator, LysR family n=1 Tax=Lutimaribacter saemankumensis TaxID=490829 RepID=A0A1G8H2B6_9RHOB|nr:LysR family transcriptional regulator [Lutimaribacter saemankumensis]SDI00719.1 DNA-binding transcriptional regulator, LysR family [Lutimaribacter saemankumensis]
MLRYTLRQLEYFVAVGEAGSIARASERINVSSPSISAAITQLEQEFGLPLFVRQHAQGLSLTQAGRQMLEQARIVLREAGAMMDIAGDIAGTVRGPMAVGCLVTFAQIVLPSLRRGFEAAYPDVRLRQLELNQLEIFSALRRSEIDVALTYDLALPADLRFEPLLSLPPFALVDETHPLAGHTDVTVEELKDHPMVLLDLPLSADYFLSFFDEIGVKPRVVERTRDMAVMRSLVANGFGYSIANVRPLNPLSPDGKPLRFIPIRGAARPMQMGLLMARDVEKSSAVRAFLTHCRDAVDEGSLPGLGGIAVTSAT